VSENVDVEIGGRQLRLSNLDKVLWPETGFTKGQMIDYYARIAEVMVPHLEGRMVTLRRWPNGVEGQSFFEKNCPKHRPPWIPRSGRLKVTTWMLPSRWMRIGPLVTSSTF
jgi:bifunctional non-homologous end joining protein LigD